MITRGEALNTLRPAAEWNMLNGEITWLDSDQTQPTEEEIRNEIVRLTYKAEVEDYKQRRAAEYPPKEDYLDAIVKDDDVQKAAYVAACQAVKDKYPKGTFDADELALRQAQALIDEQVKQYNDAVARLAQYQLSIGVPESTIEITDDAETVVTPGIPPIEATIDQTTLNDEGDATTSTIENPLITQDNAERAAAQAIVDATPQSVKDAA
jgi:hypothetical protein